jgi:DNA methyltransferase 1-associated protein 1
MLFFSFLFSSEADSLRTDAQHGITRFEIPQGQSGPSRQSIGPSVCLRSTRVPSIKPSNQAKVESILAELSISQRLVMPTRANMEKLDALVAAISTLVETKKQVDRSDHEVGVLRKRKENGETAGSVEPEAARTKRSASISSVDTTLTKKARKA